MKHMRNGGRRSFLFRCFCWMVVSLFASCRGRKGGDSKSRSRKRVVLIGSSKEFARGLTALPLYRLFVLRDEKGLACVSGVCTHQRCLLRPPYESKSSGMLSCPCHGAAFDFAGTPIVGPAVEPLPWYKLFVEQGGDLSVDLSVQVSPDWRLTGTETL